MRVWVNIALTLVALIASGYGAASAFIPATYDLMGKAGMNTPNGYSSGLAHVLSSGLFAAFTLVLILVSIGLNVLLVRRVSSWKRALPIVMIVANLWSLMMVGVAMMSRPALGAI